MTDRKVHSVSIYKQAHRTHSRQNLYLLHAPDEFIDGKMLASAL